MSPWVEQSNNFTSSAGNLDEDFTSQARKLERHLKRANFHYCCHVCRKACKNIRYTKFVSENNYDDCKKLCKDFVPGMKNDL